MDKRFFELKEHLDIAREFRTYPNGRNLSLNNSIILNTIGKNLEFMSIMLYDISKGKKIRLKKMLPIIAGVERKLSEVIGKLGRSV